MFCGFDFDVGEWERKYAVAQPMMPAPIMAVVGSGPGSGAVMICCRDER